jgi:HEAT repeat protein
VRRAALEGLLRLDGNAAQATVLAWLTSDNADRRHVAAGHLAALSEKQLDDLAAKFPGLSATESVAVFEVLVRRRGKEMLPMALAAAQSDKPELRLAGVRCLGLVGDLSTTSLLVDSLSGKGPLSDAAREALVRLPRKEVGEALIDAIKRRPEVREGAIEVLKRLRCYEAIDPLIELAATDDATEYGPALDGLRGIADPDDIDVPRLVRLWQKTPPGARRDEVERTVAVVCDKLPATADRAKPVRTAMAKLGIQPSAEGLPLLGRLGGQETLKQIDAVLAGNDPQTRRLAIRGLCNWPTVEVAERVWEIAGTADDAEIRSWAVRGYVRLITLKSDRPEAETLAALQKAMQRAEAAQDRQYVLARAGTVRTIEAVNWIAPYLDDPALAQAACRAIVEQAHHRFLRHPNMDRFGPLLEKVSRISAEPEVVERAKKYRLGL